MANAKNAQVVVPASYFDISKGFNLSEVERARHTITFIEDSLCDFSMEDSDNGA